MPLSHIPYELKMAGVTKPIIVSDAIVCTLPFFKKMLESLKVSGFADFDLFDQIPADCPVTIVEQIAIQYRNAQCDGIIAVGGGSVLDCAKSVNLLVSTGATKVESVMGMDHIPGNLKPFIAVPTTSGTGSEATKVAVVSDPVKKIKIEIITEKIIPTVSVLDPEATISLPAKVTASTGFDALTHAIESLYSLQSNPLSRVEALTAIELIVGNIENVIKNPKDIYSRLALANGSYLAGCAFSNAMVGGVHAIGHAAGAVCHVAHGDIMSVLLPAVMKANLIVTKEITSELLYWFEGAEVFSSTPVENRAEKAIESIINIRKRLKILSGLPETLSDLKIDRSQFEEIINKALDDGASITNPVSLTREFIFKILESSL